MNARGEGRGRASGERSRARPWWWRELFRIRTRLFAVQALLVVVPVAGLSFARIYERELLRAEEEGMAAVAASLAHGAARAQETTGALVDASGSAAALGAAAALQAQVRVLDASGHAVLDSGPERVEVVTRGRELLSVDVRDLRYRRGLERIPVGDPEPAGGSFSARPEVSRALAGNPGRATRITPRVRGVRLFLAEPVRLGDGRVVGAVYVSRSTYPVLVSLYRVRNMLEKLVAASLALALLSAVFLAFTISRPLRELTRAAGRIAAGERGVSLDVRGRDEVGELARAFDDMARELERRLAYISELSANVSHEFKTPIASIRGAAELLRDGAADDPATRARFLGNVLEDTERLSRLVSRLLELSRIEASPEPHEPLDYRALCDETVGRYVATGARVDLAYESRHAALRGAPGQLESVLGNLVDNALRFSPEGAQVTVRVSDDGAGGLRTAVEDRGAGISAANLPRVWDRFFTTARAQGGTGLGLSIVRAVVEAHGGAVGALAREGGGSVFWFALPRRL